MLSAAQICEDLRCDGAGLTRFLLSVVFVAGALTVAAGLGGIVLGAGALVRRRVGSRVGEGDGEGAPSRKAGWFLLLTSGLVCVCLPNYGTFGILCLAVAVVFWISFLVFLVGRRRAAAGTKGSQPAPAESAPSGGVLAGVVLLAVAALAAVGLASWPEGIEISLAVAAVVSVGAAGLRWA